MPIISGELETAIEVPTACPELANFTCGDARSQVEDVVEAIVAQLHAGERPNATLLVTRAMPERRLVGLSAIEWQPIPVVHPSFPAEAYSDAVYLAVLALSEPYRGRFKTTSGRSLSDVLLNEALTHIAAKKGTIPPVQGFVDPTNAPCLELIRGYGFEVQIEWPGELMLVRPRDQALPSWRASTISPCRRAP